MKNNRFKTYKIKLKRQLIKEGKWIRFKSHPVLNRTKKMILMINFNIFKILVNLSKGKIQLF
jgi:hypothetical protein